MGMSVYSALDDEFKHQLCGCMLCVCVRVCVCLCVCMSRLQSELISLNP